MDPRGQGQPVVTQELREVIAANVNVMTGTTEIVERVVLKNADTNEVMSDTVNVNYHLTDSVTSWIAEATAKSSDRAVEIEKFEQQEPVEPEA